MKKNEIMNHESYRRSTLKYDSMDPKRFHWNLSMDSIDKEIIELVPAGAKILEVGYGDGRLAEKLMKQRPDITFYHGIDLLDDTLKEIQDKNIRDTKFYKANCWDVLSEDGDWDFVISCGVLFTCTDPLYKSILMDLLDSTAPRGYFVLSIIMLKPKIVALEKSINNSINISDYYIKGKRTKINFPERLYNQPFWVIREGIKHKHIPKVPDSERGLPGDHNDSFNILFT